MALVDDSIKRNWHARDSRQIVLPLATSLKTGMEYVGPRRLIDEVFNRGGQYLEAADRRTSKYGYV
jgi:hypothetical protein